MSKEEFKKNDKGKPTFELIPFDLLADVNKVLQHGRDTYGLGNWKKTTGFKMSRPFNALLRHMFAWWHGEDLDKESGISHLAHAMCNLFFLMYHFKLKNGDDRPVGFGKPQGDKTHE